MGEKKKDNILKTALLLLSLTKKGVSGHMFSGNKPKQNKTKQKKHTFMATNIFNITF